VLAAELMVRPVAQHAASSNRAGIFTHLYQHATTVKIFPEKLTAFDPSANDMVQGTRRIDAGSAWHD